MSNNEQNSGQNIASPFQNLQFLKWGGSLITDKHQSHTPRLEVIHRLAGEVAAACQRRPDLHLILGHGSGSYGHIPARKFGTRQGVHTPEQWLGFVEVWREAVALNRLVIDALGAAGLPAIPIVPSSSVTASDGQVAAWDLGPLQAALRAGLLPVVYGDVVFDAQRGGTILSTEDLFSYLARQLRPAGIMLAGIEPGVWSDFPACTHLVELITPATFPAVAAAIRGSAAVDVTGGMSTKVQQSLELVQEIPALQIQIFSGEETGAVERALSGEYIGTLIKF